MMTILMNLVIQDSVNHCLCILTTSKIGGRAKIVGYRTHKIVVSVYHAFHLVLHIY